ncbi:MAG: hypothetical protein MSC31_06320 [Solirubrobacteraceae bacterium MAG38_C4-C5]|nr:hypothetical protein [Candidatus Siliceabacter maunaloa]
MQSERVTVTMPADVAKAARERVEAGESRSLSAFVAEAVEEKAKRETLREVLDDIRGEIGPPGPEAEAWADRVLGRLR